jgi:hypothetical protein
MVPEYLYQRWLSNATSTAQALLFASIVTVLSVSIVCGIAGILLFLSYDMLDQDSEVWSMLEATKNRPLQPSHHPTAQRHTLRSFPRKKWPWAGKRPFFGH